MKKIFVFLIVAIFSACSNPKEEAKKLFMDGAKAYATGDFEKAAGYFTQCINLKDDMHEAYYNRGTVYILMKKYDLALIDFNQCLKLKQDYNLAHYQKGIALQNLKNYDLALQSYSIAIKNDPMFKDAFFNRAWTYIDLKDTAQACQDFQMCKDLGVPEATKFLEELCHIPQS